MYMLIEEWRNELECKWFRSLTKKWMKWLKNDLEKLIWPASSKFLHITCAETSGSRNSGRISPSTFFYLFLNKVNLINKKVLYYQETVVIKGAENIFINDP